MKSHRSRTIAAGVALVLSLTLAGCGQADPSAAAVVNGRVVPERDVDTAVSELKELKLPQQMDAAQVTTYLVIGPMLLEKLRQAGVPISDDDARRQLQDPRVQLSQPTLEVLRTRVAADTVGQAQQFAAQPSRDQKQTEMAKSILRANDEFQQEVRQAVTSGAVVGNPKYLKQQVDWVEQDLQGQPQPPQ